MYPYLVRFNTPWGGEINIASYGVMMVIGFLLSLYILQKRAGAMGTPPEKIFNVAIAMLVCGVIGARLFHVIQFWDEGGFAQNPFLILRIDRGGLVFYGGLLGGLAGGIVSMLKNRLPIPHTLGLIASVGPLGHAFGRMGCFLNGCCFGRHTQSRLGIRFPRFLEEGNVAREALNIGDRYIRGSDAFVHHLNLGLVDSSDTWSAPVHATQLYAVVYNLLIFALLSWWLKKRKRPSELIGLYMVTYGAARFMNEMFRITESAAAGLSVAQIICIPLIAGGAALLLYQRPWSPRKGIEGV